MVALRKESVDRKVNVRNPTTPRPSVALRKESVDRKVFLTLTVRNVLIVALRKESVDRKVYLYNFKMFACMSLSARRAWIEKLCLLLCLASLPSRSPQGERG